MRIIASYRGVDECCRNLQMLPSIRSPPCFFVPRVAGNRIVRRSFLADLGHRRDDSRAELGVSLRWLSSIEPAREQKNYHLSFGYHGK